MNSKALELNLEAASFSKRPLLLSLGFVALAALAYAVFAAGASKNFVALVLVGALLGATLMYAKFGFSGAFKGLLTNGAAGAFRVHFIMIGVASLLFFPLLANQSALGLQLAGAFTPISVAYVTGAILFGMGMQLGGGCASGTLYALGGGNVRLLITVLGFIIGSTLGAYHMGFWWSLPSLETYTMHSLFGWGWGLVLHIALLAMFVVGLGRFSNAKISKKLLLGGILLALLNVCVLLLSGQPWGEAPAFALWGAKFIAQFGVDVEFWEYFVRPAFGNALEASVLRDSVSILDFSIVIGAFLAAVWRNEFKLHFHLSLWSYASAIIGGTLMGYGARLSNGCNIGAYFSGLASGSLSAWGWLAFALLGSYVVLKLRAKLAV